MTKNSWIFSAFVLLLTPVSLFGQPTMLATPKPRVMIYYQQTELKQRLLDRLTADFGARNIEVSTDLLDHCLSCPLDRYDAVVLLSNVKAFNPLPVATDFIKKNAYSPKIVYVSTWIAFNNPYGLLGLALDQTKVDAITAASPDKGNPDPAVVEAAEKKIRARVWKILGMAQG